MVTSLPKERQQPPMIDEAEFYRRFDQVVPGALVPGIAHGPVETELYFERLSMSGLEEMHRYSVDKRLYEFFEFDPFETIDATRAYIDKLQKRMAADVLKRSAMYWFVRRKQDNYLVGTASLVSLHYDRKSIEWGYGVDPALWGSGYVLQIQEMLKHYVFEVLQLNRLHGITMVTNDRTIASILAAGMKHEGTLRDYYCKKGVFVDGWQYGMVSRDYFFLRDSHPAVKTKHSIEEVVAVVSSVLSEAEITAESDMHNVSSWDSLNHMSIMVAVADKMGVSLSPLDISRATSVKAIAELVNQ